MATVEACGKLLTEMAVGSNQIPLIYGNRVLEMHDAVMKSNATQRDATNQQNEDCSVDLQWVDDVFQQASALTG